MIILKGWPGVLVALTRPRWGLLGGSTLATTLLLLSVTQSGQTALDTLLYFIWILVMVGSGVVSIGLAEAILHVRLSNKMKDMVSYCLIVSVIGTALGTLAGMGGVAVLSAIGLLSEIHASSGQYLVVGPLVLLALPFAVAYWAGSSLRINNSQFAP